MADKSSNNEWNTWPEAIRLFLGGVTLPSCIPVALVVGVILSTINQSDVILGGSATSTTWIKVGMNFVVPLCVSSYGFLNACRAQPIVNEMKNKIQAQAAVCCQKD